MNDLLTERRGRGPRPSLLFYHKAAPFLVSAVSAWRDSRHVG
jgi:hypothetical protein